MRQFQELLELLILGLAMGFHLHPTVCPIDDSTDRNHQNIEQREQFGALYARVSQLGKVLFERHALSPLYDTSSSRSPVLTNGASLFIKKINDLATGAFPGIAKIPGNSVEGRFLCFRKSLISLEVN